MKSKFHFCATAQLLLLHCCTSRSTRSSRKIPRIGFLDNGTASDERCSLRPSSGKICASLAAIEGKNIVIEHRFAEGKYDRLPELAADLVRLKVDLIVVDWKRPSAVAAKSATTTIPIVITNDGDPVGAGLVASLARPGGNITGLSSLSTELSSKRLELLKDVVPKLSRVGRSTSARRGPTGLQLKELRPAAAALEAKTGEIVDSIRPKDLRPPFKPQARSKLTRSDDRSIAQFSVERKRSSILPSNTGCRRFTSRRNLSMTAV